MLIKENIRSPFSLTSSLVVPRLQQSRLQGPSALTYCSENKCFWNAEATHFPDRNFNALSHLGQGGFWNISQHECNGDSHPLRRLLQLEALLATALESRVPRKEDMATLFTNEPAGLLQHRPELLTIKAIRAAKYLFGHRKNL